MLVVTTATLRRRLAGSGDVADRREAGVAPDPLRLAEERRGVAHAPREHPVRDDPDRHVAHRPVLGQPVAGGLEPDQPVDGGGDPDRAAPVVAVRDRDGSGGDERPGAGRRGAGVVVEVPGTADLAQACVVDRPGEAELGELGLAERDQSGGEIHPREVAVGPLRDADEGVGALLGRHAGDVDVVLDEGGHPGEPAAPRVPRLLAGAVERGVGHRTQVAVDPLGAGDGRLDHLGDRHRPRP